MEIAMGQVQTERGLITVEANYATAEKAEMDGYRYAFTTEKYGDIYSKSLDATGHYHSFAQITGF